MSELLPCPWCGPPSLLRIFGANPEQVECRKCGVSTILSMWNTRAQPIAPAVAELVNACKLLKKNSWLHKCDDGVGGCRAVSQSVFDDFKKALVAMNESEAK